MNKLIFASLILFLGCEQTSIPEMMNDAGVPPNEISIVELEEESIPLEETFGSCGMDIWEQIKEAWTTTDYSPIREDCSMPRVILIETLEETTEICSYDYPVNSCWRYGYIILWVNHPYPKYTLKDELLHNALFCAGLGYDFEREVYPEIFQEGGTFDYHLRGICEEGF